MSAYIIAQIFVEDAESYRNYMRGFRAMFGGYRGAVLVADDNIEVIEGDWPYNRTAVIRFDDADEARRWYQSDAYQAAALHRLSSARTNLILAQGLD